MKHVLLTVLVVPLAAAAGFAVLNWVFRRRGSDFPLLVSVIAQWLVAYLGWTLVIALAETVQGGNEPRRALYTTFGFAVLAALAGLWQYRLARVGARRQATRVFWWAQVGWLLLLLVERGTLG